MAAFYTYSGDHDRAYYGPFFPPGLSGGTRTIVTVPGALFTIGKPMKKIGSSWSLLRPSTESKDTIRSIVDVGWAVGYTQIETVPWTLEEYNAIQPSPVALPTSSFYERGAFVPFTDFIVTLEKHNPLEVFAEGQSIYVLESDRASKLLARSSGAAYEFIGLAAPSASGETTVTVRRIPENYPYFQPNGIPRYAPPQMFLVGGNAQLSMFKALYEKKSYKIVESDTYNESYTFLYKECEANGTEKYKETGFFSFDPVVNPMRTFLGIGVRAVIDGNYRYLMFDINQIFGAKQYVEGCFTSRLQVIAAPPTVAFTTPQPFPPVSGDIPDYGYYSKLLFRRERVTDTKYRERYYLILVPTVVAVEGATVGNLLIGGGAIYPTAWECSQLTPDMSTSDYPPPANSHIILFGQRPNTTATESAILAVASTVAREAPTQENPTASLNRRSICKINNASPTPFSHTYSSNSNNNAGGSFPEFPSDITLLYKFHDFENMQAFAAYGSGGWTSQAGYVYSQAAIASVTEGLYGTRKQLTGAGAGLFDVPTWTTDDMPIPSRVPPVIRFNFSGFELDVVGVYLFTSRAAKLDFDIPEKIFNLAYGQTFRSQFYAGHEAGPSDIEPIPSVRIPSSFARLDPSIPIESLTGSVVVTLTNVSDTLDKISADVTTKINSIVDHQPAIYLIRCGGPIITYAPWVFTSASANGVREIDVPRGYTYLVWIPALNQKNYFISTPPAPTLTNPSGNIVAWIAIDSAIKYEIYRDSILVATQDTTSFSESLTTGTYSYTVKSVGAFTTSPESLPLIIIVP